MVQLIKPILAIGSTSFSLTGPGIDPGTDPTTKLETVISNTIAVLTIVAVIFFVLQIIFAGYAFISSRGDEKKLEIAKDRLTNNVLGLFIVVVAVGLGALIAKLVGIPNILDLNQTFTKMGL
ncbi:MAG: hypothetical protein Q8P53_02890 [Candidatus Shapirobacteria bacterium]|nr:hypothetical protein [Candidatus Shapirobacteria bacterium]